MTKDQRADLGGVLGRASAPDARGRAVTAGPEPPAAPVAMAA